MLGRLPKANAVNEAGGQAYKLEPKHALAQVAATGTFGNAFYSTAETQLDEVLKLIDEVDDNQYLAKLALYAREKAFMKDMPAALLVALSVRDTELMHRVFDRVVDNGRVLRTVFQMIRSGQFKKSRPLSERAPAQLLSERGATMVVAALACRALCSERSSAG
jgi:60 kDa SS-A/Ro ribonucleoprotein